jgi:2-polyprenyl-3-methyl-5-hydroxy-6-metoxy-1,4-benzoquinol methylase
VDEETYGSDYYQKTHKNWFENPNYPLFAQLASEISHHKSNAVLDVGCGNGAFLNYLANVSDGLNLQGIDLSNEAVSITGIEFLQDDFLTYGFQKKFDAIVSLAVIEHLSDVTSFPRRIHDLLNKDGIACVMTLNESGLLYRFANLLRKIGVSSVFIRLYDPHHINHFSKDSLERLLTKDGLFKLKKIIDHNTPLAAIDVPASNFVMKWVMKLGVAAIFFVGKITKKAYLQTIVVIKVE